MRQIRVKPQIVSTQYIDLLPRSGADMPRYTSEYRHRLDFPQALQVNQHQAYQPQYLYRIRIVWKKLSLIFD